MRIVIADDDPLTAQQLAHHCRKLAPDSEVLLVGDGTAAIGSLRWGGTALLLLDLDMPGMDGRALLEAEKPNCPVVIVTGDPAFALEAFQFDVRDYLIKPVSFERFKQAWNKIFAQGPMPPGTRSSDRVFVRSGSEIVQVDLSDVLFVRSESNHVVFVQRNGEVSSLMNMKDLEKKLPSNFVRVHRSYLVNLAHVVKLDTQDLLVGGELIPVSATYRQQLMARLDLL
ncbi:MAG: response regulator transcription factor [Flavobacteriales bacterium]|nr:response regulator transcription factor [Flavobacteriales bacterium]